MLSLWIIYKLSGSFFMTWYCWDQLATAISCSLLAYKCIYIFPTVCPVFRASPATWFDINLLRWIITDWYWWICSSVVRMLVVHKLMLSSWRFCQRWEGYFLYALLSIKRHSIQLRGNPLPNKISSLDVEVDLTEKGIDEMANECSDLTRTRILNEQPWVGTDAMTGTNR